MHLQRLLVAVDFSDASSDAARWVSRSFAPGASIVLAHIIELPDPPKLFGHVHARQDEILETLRIGASERLRGLSRVIPRSRPEIRRGHFPEALNELCATEGVELIAVGGHSDQPDDWEESSGGAEKLIGTSRVPVLAIVQPLAGTPRHVLAAIDGSPQGAHVLSWASGLARGFGSVVTALHVVPSSLADTALAAAEVVFGAPPVRFVDVAAPLATSDVVSRAAEASDPSHDAVTSTVAIGDPATEILGAARRIGADLIVLGRRRTGGLRRAVLGSVVHQVLRDARCPVLVVPEVSA